MSNEDVVKEGIKNLLKPVAYFKTNPSCPKVMNICETVNAWVKASDEDVKKISDYWLDMYSTIVMLDDFLDGTDVRKGSPSAHIKFGVPRVVIAAVMGQSVLCKKANELCPNSDEAVRQHYIDYWYSNGIELYWRETLVAPTIEEYLGVTAIKWSALRHVANMLQLRVGDTQDLSDILRMYTTFIGVSNDFSDLILNPYEGKHVCDDMTEGKFTLPAVYAHNIQKNEEIGEILKLRSKDQSVKKRYVSILKETGSIDFTKEFATQLHKEIAEKIKEIGENAEMTKNIDEELNKIVTSEIAV